MGSLDTDGEGVEKEKHSNEQGEIEGRSKKTNSFNDETTKNLDMTFEDENVDDFVLVDYEYRDPLADVTGDHSNNKRISKISLLSYSSSTSTGSGISGLFHHLSLGEERSGEQEKPADGDSNDTEEVTMGDVEILGAIEQDDDCSPTKISADTK